MKTVEDFRRQVAEKDIKRWKIHNCSMCGYGCGYLFREDGVYYDSGCDCSYGPLRSSSWGEVAEHYNRQSSEEYIKVMDDFWGFTNNTLTA